jgi:hypothetical protein
MYIDQFIEKSQRIHGEDHFDYSETKYGGYNKRLTLKCNITGMTETVLPQSHYRRCEGCQPTKKKTRIKKKSKTFEDTLKENFGDYIKKVEKIDKKFVLVYCKLCNKNEIMRYRNLLNGVLEYHQHKYYEARTIRKSLDVNNRITIKCENNKHGNYSDTLSNYLKCNEKCVQCCYNKILNITFCDDISKAVMKYLWSINA